MTRLIPLTALGLGRSPYDSVFQGTGVADPRQPLQLYDVRGRPFNPNSRRIFRELVRAQNQVLQVVGVIEYEKKVSEDEAEVLSDYKRYEEKWGFILTTVGISMMCTFARCAYGLRQRVLVYGRYGRINLLWGLLRYEYKSGGWMRRLLACMPSWAIADAARDIWLFAHQKWSIGSYIGTAYLLAHLNAFTAMVTLGIFSSPPLFPDLHFFVPFTPLSPMAPISPIPSTLTLPVMSSWLVELLTSVAPFALLVLYGELKFYIATVVLAEPWLNKDDSNDDSVSSVGILSSSASRRSSGANTSSLHGMLEEQHHHQDIPRVTPGVDSPPLTAGLPLDDTSPEPHPNQENIAPWPSVLRSSSQVPAEPLTTAVEYSSEDDGEDNSHTGAEEVAPMTINIQFAEVEQTQGSWAAEFRMTGPAASLHSSSSHDSGIVYRLSPLTLVPWRLGSYMLMSVGVHAALMPLEAVALRMLARSYLGRQNRPLGDLLGWRLWEGIRLRSITHWLTIDFTSLFFSAAVTISFILLGLSITMSEQEWVEKHKSSKDQQDS